MHGFTISVPVLILSIFIPIAHLYYPFITITQLLLRNGKISSKSVFWIERTQRAISRWQQQSYFRSFLNNFSIIHFQIGIIIWFNCYQQPNIKYYLTPKRRIFFADTVWTLQIPRFNMACCWKQTFT